MRHGHMRSVRQERPTRLLLPLGETPASLVGHNEHTEKPAKKNDGLELYGSRRHMGHFFGGVGFDVEVGTRNAQAFAKDSQEIANTY